jgi:CheY-like chemotaxis protein
MCNALQLMSDRPKIVVVAEDETLIRMLAVDVLIDAGFAVIEAGHADDALAILNSQATDIHVLFTDIHMPGSMDGLELAHHTRRHWPWIALLVASGKGKPSFAELPPGSRFLSKPYEPSHVVAHVRELIAP